MQCIINYLNQNSGAIQAVTTIVLVVVTIWSSISTKRMANLMKDQITSKILIEKSSIGSQFSEKRNSKEIFTKNSVLQISARFDVRNEGNASGSIYKPNLLISIPKINLAYTISPKTKSYEDYNHRSNTYMSSYDTRTINHGSSIFLYGGASDRIELSYRFDIDTDERVVFANEAIKNSSTIEYKLVTTDNSGRKYEITVTDIQEEAGFGIS